MTAPLTARRESQYARKRRGVSLRNLIDKQLIDGHRTLVFTYKQTKFTSTVNEEGLIVESDQVYKTPSTWTNACVRRLLTGNDTSRTNPPGYDRVMFAGRTLNAIRDEYIAKYLPDGPPPSVAPVIVKKRVSRDVTVSSLLKVHGPRAYKKSAYSLQRTCAALLDALNEERATASKVDALLAEARVDEARALLAQRELAPDKTSSPLSVEGVLRAAAEARVENTRPLVDTSLSSALADTMLDATTK